MMPRRRYIDPHEYRTLVDALFEFVKEHARLAEGGEIRLFRGDPLGSDLGEFVSFGVAVISPYRVRKRFGLRMLAFGRRAAGREVASMLNTKLGEIGLRLVGFPGLRD